MKQEAEDSSTQQKSNSLLTPSSH